MNLLRAAASAAIIFSAIPLLASEASEKPRELAAYEDCLTRVFTTSKAVGDVLSQCEHELEAFVQLHSERVRRKIRNETMAETQRELRAQRASEE
jgi:hypothetical protein